MHLAHAISSYLTPPAEQSHRCAVCGERGPLAPATAAQAAAYARPALLEEGDLLCAGCAADADDADAALAADPAFQDVCDERHAAYRAALEADLAADAALPWGPQWSAADALVRCGADALGLEVAL